MFLGLPIHDTWSRVRMHFTRWPFALNSASTADPAKIEKSIVPVIVFVPEAFEIGVVSMSSGRMLDSTSSPIRRSLSDSTPRFARSCYPHGHMSRLLWTFPGIKFGVSDEMGGENILWVTIDLDGTPALNDLPISHYDDPIGNCQSLRLIMRNINRGQPDLSLESPNFVAHFSTQFGIQVTQRLVEQCLWLAGKRARMAMRCCWPPESRGAGRSA